MGFDSFSAAGSCSAEDQATFSRVEVDQSLFQGNLASDHGGAIGVQSGTLKLTVRDACSVCCPEFQLHGHTHRMQCWCYVLCCSPLRVWHHQRMAQAHVLYMPSHTPVSLS